MARSKDMINCNKLWVREPDMMHSNYAIIIRHENPEVVDAFDRAGKEVLEAAGVRDFRRIDRDGNWCHFEIYQKITSLRALSLGNRISQRIGVHCESTRPWQSRC